MAGKRCLRLSDVARVGLKRFTNKIACLHVNILTVLYQSSMVAERKLFIGHISSVAGCGGKKV